MEILTADKLELIIRKLNFIDSEAEKIDDSLLCQFLKYMHVLEQLDTKETKDNTLLDINDLFYSRYYWLSRFKERYFTLYGHDEGLEQQSFMMLSEYSERFPEGIDWNIIEHIDNNLI